VFVIFEEYEGVTGGFQLQYDLMNPFNVIDMVREPSYENLVMTAYNPTIAYGGFKLASIVSGTAMPSFWTRQVTKGYMTASNLRFLGGVAVRSAPVVAVAAVPAVLAAGYAYQYEKLVNEPLRRSHGSTQGTWFGAFASGFGTVV
jgi:hypothetical protein